MDVLSLFGEPRNLDWVPREFLTGTFISRDRNAARNANSGKVPDPKNAKENEGPSPSGQSRPAGQSRPGRRGPTRAGRKNPEIRFFGSPTNFPEDPDGSIWVAGR